MLKHLLPLFLLVWLALTGAPAALAQTPPPQEKIDKLVELLADPQIKTWLEERGKPAVAVAVEPPSSVPTLSSVIASIRAHIQHLVAAIRPCRRNSSG